MNKIEAIAGTNPNDATSPAGIVRSTILHLPATPGIPAANGNPATEATPEAFTVTWPTKMGKVYKVCYSADLIAASWLAVGDPLPGTGGTIFKTIPVTQLNGGIPAKLFFRVNINDEDPDNDGLTSSEEWACATDPLKRDSDGDGINDGIEVRYGTNPTLPDQGPGADPSGSQDSDNDGLSGAAENEAGTNPNSPDTDQDGKLDGQDAVPLEKLLNWKKTPESNYLKFEIQGTPDDYVAIDMNDKGQVLFKRNPPPESSYRTKNIRYLTEPVGAIWTPGQPGGSWQYIYFKPQPFQMTGIQAGEDTIVTINSPLHDEIETTEGVQEYGTFHEIWHCNLSSIADDGSVLCSALYYYHIVPLNEAGSPDYENMTSAGSECSFIWLGQNTSSYAACKVLGNASILGKCTDYSDEYDSFYTGYFSAGFYNERIGSILKTYAVTEYQPRRWDGSFPVPVKIRLFDVTAPQNMHREIDAGVKRDPTDFNGSISQPTAAGHHLMRGDRGAPLSKIVSLSTSVSTAVELASLRDEEAYWDIPKPLGFHEMVIDRPTELAIKDWGFGGVEGIQAKATSSLAKTDEVLPLYGMDSLGTAIGVGPHAKQVWRNAKWTDLDKLILPKSTTPTEMTTKKITQSGMILISEPGAGGGGVVSALLPMEVTAFKRGSIHAPGPAISRPTDPNIVYETVTLENADYDETSWQPSSMADGARTNNQDGVTEEIDRLTDDDFVKLRFRCPAPAIAGSSEIVFDQAGQGERMQADDIRFYTSDEQKVLLADLKVTDLSNPSGPLAEAFGADGLNLFAEIVDLGKITAAQGNSESITRKYADLSWKITLAGTTTEQKFRIYRGGFWRTDRTDNTGSLSLFDGKGRKSDGSIDYGNRIKGPFRIKTGQAGNPDETAPNLGPTPMGWYGLFNRSHEMRTSWLGSARPQTNHHNAANADFLGYVQQGSYCQWAHAGNYNIPGKGLYGYDNNSSTEPYLGMPDSIHFKFELSPIGNFTTRTMLQIHPDGFCDGTAGCVGIQSYDDCCKVLFLIQHYFQTRLLVD